ncbi:MAG: HAD family phosphatase [SAR202 cluster bacterium]|nr:HAD family phosphatase [SAR202 cluster bacterium]|tara:strand:+ start:2453 stop:3274 length:822 start_codon:yes stop_codon:yes gene_type:complete
MKTTEKYKLIAFDIDGTIKATNKDISNQMICSISRANKLGAKITVITGRSYLSAKDVVSQIDLSVPIVSFQGAHIANPITDQVYWKKIIDNISLKKLINILEKYDNEILFYTEKEIFTNKISTWNNNYSKRNNTIINVLKDFNELNDMEIIRITVICPSGAKQFSRFLKNEIKNDLYVTSSLANFCEILNPDAGKTNGLKTLASMLNIDKKNILSFGNSNEDLGMLDWSGHGVIVEDNNIKLENNTLNHCLSVTQNGPSIYLNQLIDENYIGI